MLIKSIIKLIRTLSVIFLIVSVTLGHSAEKLRVGLVLDKGGKEDKSFNSAAYLGASQAEKELGIELKYVEATDVNSIENFASRVFALVAISRSVAKKGAEEKSLQYLQEALGLSEEIGRLPLRVKALNELAERFAERGDQ